MQNEVQYRGDELTVLASDLITANTIASGLPLSGELAIMGDVVGVCATSPAAATDSLAIKTKGVFTLPVKGTTGTNAAIAKGARVYASSTTLLISATSTDVHVGWALEPVASGATTTVEVKLKH